MRVCPKDVRQGSPLFRSFALYILFICSVFKSFVLPENYPTRQYRRLQRQVSAAVKQFSLLAPGDKVLIGLSGGKDSLALLELLARMRMRLNRNFDLVALHVRMDNVDYRTDDSYLTSFAAELEVPLHVLRTGFEADRKAGRTPCFLCSWTRRKLLFEKAQEWGCGKIALGHHRDDILRTALMNLAFNGSFATMPVRMEMDKFPVTIIRPLALTDEDALREWAALRGYRKLEKVCPHDGASARAGVGEVEQALLRLNPESRQSLWHALEKAGALEHLRVSAACAE